MRAVPVSPIRLMTLLAVGIAACGGGDGSTGTAGIDGTGLQPVASFGAVAGFGSVLVNDVTFDTSNATITLDGEPSTQSDLALGDVVLVRGTLNEDGTSGTADSIDFDDIVEGPISSIDLSSQSFFVLSQFVRVTADTVFDAAIQPPALESLSVDDIVEVSGFVDSNGNITATSIQRKPELVELELTGIVSNSNDIPGDVTFNINAQVVNYSQAQLEGFPDGFPRDGDLVEVKGSAIDGLGQLIATRVIFGANEIGAPPGAVGYLDGFITRFTSATDFDVSGFPVTTNEETVFFLGFTAADLGLNRQVLVQGDINASGVVVAEIVDIVPIPTLGAHNYEPNNGLNGAGLLMDHGSGFFDYSSRKALPGCANTPSNPDGDADWWILLDREFVDGVLIETAQGDDILVDIVLPGSMFDGCHGATNINNGVLQLSTRPIGGFVGGSCEAQFYWEFDYTNGPAGTTEYFSMESTDWSPLVPPLHLCDPTIGRSIELLGDFNFFRNTVEGGITTKEFIETATLDFFIVFHFCHPGSSSGIGGCP